MLYGTTDKFLRVFGLTTLEDLPATETILPPNSSGDQLSIAVEGELGEEAEGEIVDPNQLTLEDVELSAASGSDFPPANDAEEEAP